MVERKDDCMGKVIITGPGRSGTSFLVQLLTRLGLDTGFEAYNEDYDPKIRAGCEWIVHVDFNHPKERIKSILDNAPRVLKSPEWGLELKRLVRGGYMNVDYVLIPVRDLEQAATSRLNVGLDWKMPEGQPKGNERIALQAEVLALALGRAVEACLMEHLPCQLIEFPLFVQNEKYCWRKLKDVLEGIERKRFTEEWTKLAKPEQIGQWQRKSNP